MTYAQTLLNLTYDTNRALREGRLGAQEWFEFLNAIERLAITMQMQEQQHTNTFVKNTRENKRSCVAQRISTIPRQANSNLSSSKLHSSKLPSSKLPSSKPHSSKPHSSSLPQVSLAQASLVNGQKSHLNLAANERQLSEER